MKKHYHIREYSPIWWMREILPILGIIAVLVGAGIMTSWDLGLL